MRPNLENRRLAGNERLYMYHYMLPVSNKNIVDIAKRAFDLVDPRLMGHGERVAGIMFQMLKADGSYEDQETRNLLALAVLHDIGAYKTEEIDRMVEFETRDVWNHSIYGYLFFYYFSLFRDLSQVILYHHADWTMLRQIDSAPDAIKKAAQILQLADRLDIYLGNPRNKDHMEGFYRYLERERDKRFSSEVIDLFCGLQFVPQSLHYVKLELEYDRIMEAVPFTEEEKESVLRMLIYAIDFRSAHTVTHSITTTVISSELARRLYREQDTINDIFCGAMLHDLGKIGIPVEILEFPGKLSPQAMKVMKTHVDLTGHILGDSVSSAVKDIALRHHEKLDGSGYPGGLKAEALNVPQRIVAVADIASALTGTRSYKGAFSKDKTVDIMMGMAKQGFLDEGIVKLMLDNYDAVMESVRQKTGPLLKQYLGMQDRYWEILHHVKGYLEVL